MAQKWNTANKKYTAHNLIPWTRNERWTSTPTILTLEHNINYYIFKLTSASPKT